MNKSVEAQLEALDSDKLIDVQEKPKTLQQDNVSVSEALHEQDKLLSFPQGAIVEPSHTNTIIIKEPSQPATSKPIWLEYTSILPAVISAAAVLFSIYKFSSELKEKRENERKISLKKQTDALSFKLEEFYLPFTQLRSQSASLYSVFACEYKREAKAKGDTFRTLEFLCEEKQLSDSDLSILKEISKVSKLLLRLIQTKGHLVNEREISALVGKYATHIRLIVMAADNRLLGKSRELVGLVYPLEVDGAIHSNIGRIEDEIEALTSETPKRSIKPSDTVKYYNDTANEYALSSNKVSMTNIYDPFEKELKKYGTILDAGCGAGRDTKYFINQGYRVESFDASSELTNLCNKYPFAHCKNATFDSFKTNTLFDGIWASASLLHVSQLEIENTLKKLYSMLAPPVYSSDGTILIQSSVLYFSIKNIEGNELKVGNRVFYCHTEKDLDDILIDKLGMKKIKSWINEGGRKEDPSSFTNYLYRKI